MTNTISIYQALNFKSLRFRKIRQPIRSCVLPQNKKPKTKAKNERSLIVCGLLNAFNNLIFLTKSKNRENLTMNEIIFLVEDAPEGGFIAKALDYSIYTDAETVAELRTNVRDAVTCHFEETEKPSLIRLHFVHDEVIAA